MTKNYTLNQIYEQCAEDEVAIMLKDEKLIVVVDPEDMAKRIYKITNEYPLMAKLVEIDYEKIAERLAEGLDTKMLMVDVLRNAPPLDILDVVERLESPTASVSTAPRCTAIMIGGKPGRPLELVIRR